MYEIKMEQAGRYNMARFYLPVITEWYTCLSLSFVAETAV